MLLIPCIRVYSSLITHSRSWALLEKPPIMQPLNNFPTLYGTRRFITVFTRALQWSIFWAISTQFSPSHPISLRSISILSTHLCLCLPSSLFPSGFHTNIICLFLFYAFILHSLPITSSLTWSFLLYVGKSKSSCTCSYIYLCKSTLINLYIHTIIHT
jgi:hypothetical protein